MFLLGVPEVICSVCFYTLLQENLKLDEESIFHALGYSIFLCYSCPSIQTRFPLYLNPFRAPPLGFPVMFPCSCYLF